MQQHFSIHGVLTVTALYPGRSEVLVRTSNTVTEAGVEAVLAMLSGGREPTTVGGVPITEGNVLIDATAHTMKATAAVSPTDPAASDTALEGAIIRTWSMLTTSPGLSVAYPEPGQIVLSGTVPAAEDNGVLFTEEGIFTREGVLLARTTFLGVRKTSSFALKFDHTFKFEVA